MSKSVVGFALAVGVLSVPSFAGGPLGPGYEADDPALASADGDAFNIAPLQPGYKVDEPLQLLFREYCVTGPNVSKPGEGSSLVCVYSTRPVVMVYTREINAPVIRLVKKLDEATKTYAMERLGSYVVLLCDRQGCEKELKALAVKEKIERVLLSQVVMNKTPQADGRVGPRWKSFDAKFGADAETTVILASSRRQVKASYAYRRGELGDQDIERILADLPKILPKKD
jgi:hypothetical protein